MGQPLGVVDILVAGETPENRLAQERAQAVADIPAASAIAEHGCGEIRETKSVVQFAIGEQATIRRDTSAMEFELDPAVETEPQSRLLAFTRPVCTRPIPSIRLNSLAESAEHFSKMRLHLGNAGPHQSWLLGSWQNFVAITNCFRSTSSQTAS
jgi:hypothetical protein